MNILQKTLDYYQEIFRFIVQSDDYRKYIFLMKKMLKPWDSKPIDDGGDKDTTAPQEDGMTLVSLHDKVFNRVREKFGFELQDLDEWDPGMDPYDVFCLLRGIAPAIVIPVPDPLTLFGCSASDLERCRMDRYHYVIVGIDPTSPKKELLHGLDLALRPHIQAREKRRPKKAKVPRGEAFRLARLEKTFKEIGLKFGVHPTTAHKAFMRDFEEIYGKEYQPGFTDRKEVPIHQLVKTCATCAERSSCKKLCPEVNAYVRQDSRSIMEKLGTSPGTKKPARKL